MIKFPCHCGFQFNLLEEKAGSVEQCPRCGRLNDVPTLNDLRSLAEDGTIILEPVTEEEEQNRLNVLERAFAPQRTDARGDEIDLRVTMEDIKKAGSEEVPLELKDEVRPGRPRYDPVTGELVRPFGIKKDEGPSPDEIPMARQALAYASEDVYRRLTPARLLIELFQPVNFVVMMFVFFGHIIVAMMGAILKYVLWYVGMTSSQLMLPFLIPFIAHYGTVIEDTGPDAHTELPRPLRSVSWHDDIWGPFLKMFFSLMVCYWPVLAFDLASHFLGWHYPWARFALFMVGSMFVPAVMLAFVTTGALANLSPAIITNVIARCGLGYLLPMLTWMIIAPIYLFCTADVLIIPIDLPMIMLSQYAQLLGLPLLVFGVYLMHWYSWQLGLLYGHHHDALHWVYQRRAPRDRAPSPALPDAAARGAAAAAARRRGQ